MSWSCLVTVNVPLTSFVALAVPSHLHQAQSLGYLRCADPLRSVDEAAAFFADPAQRMTQRWPGTSPRHTLPVRLVMFDTLAPRLRTWTPLARDYRLEATFFHAHILLQSPYEGGHLLVYVRREAGG